MKRHYDMDTSLQSRVFDRFPSHSCGQQKQMKLHPFQIKELKTDACGWGLGPLAAFKTGRGPGLSKKTLRKLRNDRDDPLHESATLELSILTSLEKFA